MKTSDEIYVLLRKAFGILTALAIMEVIYPEIYGRGKGEKIEIRRPK